MVEEDNNLERKTLQAYCFGNRNVLRSDLKGRGRSFHIYIYIYICTSNIELEQREDGV